MRARTVAVLAVAPVLVFIAIEGFGAWVYRSQPLKIPVPLSGDEFLQRLRDSAVSAEGNTFSQSGDAFETLALHAAYDWRQDGPETDEGAWFGRAPILPRQGMVLDLASLDEQDSWQIQDIDSTDVRKWLIPKNQVAACVVGPDGPVAAATKIPLTPRPDVAVLISLPGRLFCFSPFERSYWTIPDKWRLKNSRAESAR